MKPLSFFVVVLVTLLLSSCDKGSQQEDDDIVEGRELLEEEYQAVAKVCDSLQDKRLNFEVRGDRSLRYNYRVQERTCFSSSDVDVRIQLIFRSFIGRGDDFFWEGPRNQSYFRDVITDEAGLVSYICARYFDGSKVDNLIVRGKRKLLYKFSYNHSHGAVVINTYQRDNDSKEKLVNVEGLKIDIRPQSSTRGHVLDREMSKSCGDSGKHNLRQLRI